MKRILKNSAIAGAMLAAVSLVSLAPSSRSDAQAAQFMNYASGEVYGGYSGYGYSPYGYGYSGYTYVAPRAYVYPPIRPYIYRGFGAGPYGYGAPGGYVYRPYGYRAYRPFGTTVYGPYSTGFYGPYGY